MNYLRFCCYFVLSFFLVACDSIESQKGKVTILHMGSHLSHIDQHSDFEFQFNDLAVTTEAGGFPRVIKKFKELRKNNKHSISIHAGNAIIGSVYYELFRGEADAEMMNEVCFDSLMLGELELALPPSSLVEFLNFVKNTNVDCTNTHILSANVIPKIEPSKLEGANSDEPRWQPYAIKHVNGQDIAMIGLNNLRIAANVVSSKVSAYEFLDEVDTAQKYINLLKKRGIKQFILISRLSYAENMKLASKLTDVDAIIGGDFKILLGKFSAYGLNNDEPYPTVVKNKDGDKTCVVESGTKSLAVGELQLLFDDEGKISQCSGKMNLLLAKNKLQLFDKNSKKQNKPELIKQLYSALEKDEQISLMDEDKDARAKLNSLSIAKFKSRKVATALENLCLDWIPGSYESRLCSNGETAKRGSDITSLVVNSVLTFIPQADMSIQNAGSVRRNIRKGAISIDQVYQLLPFRNKLILVRLSGQQIKEVLEQAVEFSLSESGSKAAYPYAANLRWNLHAYKPKGSRVEQLEYKNKEQDEWQPIPENKTFSVVINDFISKGNDGYILFSQISAEDKSNTQIDYTELFLEYLREQKTIQKLESPDYSTQNYFARPPK